MEISSRTLIVSAVVVMVLVALGIWVGLNLGNSGSGAAGNSPYSVVYLTTGDIYFGKFSMFPTPRIIGAWALQRGTNQQNQPTVGVTPVTSAFWAPSDVLYLSEKQIVAWSPLAADSQVAKALANPNGSNQNQVQIPITPSSTPAK